MEKNIQRNIPAVKIPELYRSTRWQAYFDTSARMSYTLAEFYNYKGTHSIVLMAIVDGNYNFIYVSIGCQGRISDEGVFRDTEFSKRLEDESLNIPSE